jgi:hypothetical protein
LQFFLLSLHRVLMNTRHIAHFSVELPPRKRIKSKLYLDEVCALAQASHRDIGLW